ncbi:MBL fold metallo-hydrolase [Sphingobacterium sp. SRCM116780]|uniref:MBL fold metallo-hydrolase n=1 Tax=Sphingobacterium sp. SRCM116780 TaxID=2907623 RepID=UPI001F4218C9|nr:MBL fold metallo-hydrolase [Sphingobacterium sp. SRCM116780]UIR55617.1 MBL fold metallo-hydrolase [Sphingobacterium sp. SRCM116780]
MGNIYLMRPLFGGQITGDRLDRVKNSPNYKNSQFQNLEYTPAVKEGESLLGSTCDFLFKDREIRSPKNPLPVVQQDLKSLPSEDLMIWFGHSSYLLQIDGKKILVDPVFSNNASPVPGSNKPFKMSYVYQAADFPAIDLLLISHDHYDHLDYETIEKMGPQIKRVICGLGVGAHFERWGFKEGQITELDWYDETTFEDKFKIISTPARHFSGRKFQRNNTLWTSFVFQTEKYNLFLGGDSGYGKHFKTIGDKYGPFDLAILENGQYNETWRYIHTMPEELLKEVVELKAKHFIPVHSAKFALALHDWKEPLALVAKHAEEANIPVLTPKMGEIVYLNKLDQSYEKWWEGLK